MPGSRGPVALARLLRERRIDLVLALTFVLGLWLRWGLNGTWRLGPDEALYASWARRIASGADVWLAHTTGVDKPPLFIYAMSVAMTIYGYTEFATRVVSILASAISILLAYALAGRLYGSRQVARLAAVLLALSPFAILYAPTAFADPLLVMWLLLASVLACDGHWALAGVATALAILTKQEALALVPLMIILGGMAGGACLASEHQPDLTGLPAPSPRDSAARGARSVGQGPPDPPILGGGGRVPPRIGGLGGPRRATTRPRVLSLGGSALPPLLHGWLVYLAATAAVALAVEMLWEWQRPGQPSPFALGLSNYGGIAVTPAGDWLPRLGVWWNEALRYAFDSPLLNLLLLAGAPVLLALSRGSRARADRVLVAAVAYVVLVHTVLSFQLWNRYMLLAVPLLCILLARTIDAGCTLASGLRTFAGRDNPVVVRLLALALAAVLLAAPVSRALAGETAVGSDHGVYTGIDDAAGWVRDNVPPGSVIYHHSLGWQLGWYLYGVHMDFWWYPSPDWLAQTAAGRAEHSQYIIVPSWEVAALLRRALSQNNLVLLPVHTALRPDGSVSFQTYRIAPER